jgi:hypothetical protein
MPGRPVPPRRRERAPHRACVRGGTRAAARRVSPGCLSRVARHRPHCVRIGGDTTKSPPAQGDDDLALSRPVKLVVLAVKERAARCRLLGSGHDHAARGKPASHRRRNIVTVAPPVECPGALVTPEARAIDRLAQVLASTGAPGAFATRQTASADELQLDVSDLGPIPLPLSPAIARRLRCGIAHPARCGLRGQTLLDWSVRDAWELGKRKVTIDSRRWLRALDPELLRSAW